MPINIHIEIPPLERALIQRANAALHGRSASDIRFEGCSATLPHVTLLMGEVRRSRLDEVAELTRDWAADQSPIVLALDRPSLPDDKGWVFLNARAMSGDLKVIRNSLADALGSSLSHAARGGPENHSHMTLGLCRGGAPEGYELLVQPFELMATRIGIGDAGALGTVARKRVSVTLGEPRTPVW